MSDADKTEKTDKVGNTPWWTFDECRLCTMLRLFGLGALVGASLVVIYLLVT